MRDAKTLATLVLDRREGGERCPPGTECAIREGLSMLGRTTEDPPSGRAFRGLAPRDPKRDKPQIGFRLFPNYL
jgi:hypothetical protein